MFDIEQKASRNTKKHVEDRKNLRGRKSARYLVIVFPMGPLNTSLVIAQGILLIPLLLTILLLISTALLHSEIFLWGSFAIL